MECTKRVRRHCLMGPSLGSTLHPLGTGVLTVVKSHSCLFYRSPRWPPMARRERLSHQHAPCHHRPVRTASIAVEYGLVSRPRQTQERTRPPRLTQLRIPVYDPTRWKVRIMALVVLPPCVGISLFVFRSRPIRTRTPSHHPHRVDAFGNNKNNNNNNNNKRHLAVVSRHHGSVRLKKTSLGSKNRASTTIRRSFHTG